MTPRSILGLLMLVVLASIWGCDNDTTNDVGSPAAGTDKTCLGCHSSEDLLKEALGLAKTAPGESAKGSGQAGDLPPLEPWEKVLIAGANGAAFLASVHGPFYDGDANPAPHVLTCQHCHAGRADDTFLTMAEAHEGMIADPSVPGQSGCTGCHATDFAASACDACHADQVADGATSLHTTLRGFKTAIEERCPAFASGDFDGFFTESCASCHGSCGQCHVSRPDAVGGGFARLADLSLSHRFASEPSMTEQCTACHGATVGADFRGELPGNAPDAHHERGLDCAFCHTAAELHGDGTAYDHRYEVEEMPRCRDCHEADVAVNAGTSDCAVCHPGGGVTVVPAARLNHAHHAGVSANCMHCHDPVPHVALPTAQCQVCHSQPSTGCTNCHDLGGGLDAYAIDPSAIQFKIGRNANPARSEYDIAVVRHAPVDPETYANWGLDAPDYDSRPTWQYASPHNIALATPQTAAVAGQNCAYSCHRSPSGPDGFLLRESDLYEADGTTPLPDYEANLGVVIPGTFPGDR
ncbi:MAG TPA: hypothetical protein PLL30_03715 [Candidatus Krumholzibacteria bacterium]|nr:hypothetical protein [Candidatus Krumholzibacteria bacterium]HPD70881.1 hypothetical protein [Candidatus Krumholzibacteria bacterium]HRY39419.1 hypothetical protein [Candidatus Krumholzibacteria bacterium]